MNEQDQDYEDQLNAARVAAREILDNWRAQGKLGLPGPKGEKGEDGKDAVVDEEKLAGVVRGFLLKNRRLFRGQQGPSGHIIRETTRQSSGDAGAGAVPVGGVIMWSGTIADAGALAPDWALCNGTDNAPGPDLRDKFIVGASQDDAGVAKSNVEGSLKQTGGVTGVSHSAHANLVHAGGAVGDHTGLTHGLTIADHPSLTHPAITFAAQTLSHGDHAIASFSGNIPSRADLSRPSGSIASHAAGSIPSGSVTIASGTHAHAASTLTPTMASINTGVLTTPTAATRGTLSATTQTVVVASFSGTHASQTGSIASAANASMPSGSFASGADVSMPALTHSHAASTLTHADHSIASSSQAMNTHAAVAHTFTAPAAHGTAGTLTHSFTQPDTHVISGHDTVLSLPVYYALAFIQRML